MTATYISADKAIDLLDSDQFLLRIDDLALDASIGIYLHERADA